MRSTISGVMRDIMRSIMRNIPSSITLSFRHSINSQHRAEEKLTGEISTHRAKFALLVPLAFLQNIVNNTNLCQVFASVCSRMATLR